MDVTALETDDQASLLYSQGSPEISGTFRRQQEAALLVPEGGPGHLSEVEAFSEDTVSQPYLCGGYSSQCCPSMGHSGTFLFISEIKLSLSHKDLAVVNIFHGPAARGITWHCF